MIRSCKNASVRALRVASFGLGLALMISAASGLATAGDGTPNAPEVDPGSLASVVTLVTGGVLTLTGRIRRGR